MQDPTDPDLKDCAGLPVSQPRRMVELIALRHQGAVLNRQRPSPLRLYSVDRMWWIVGTAVINRRQEDVKTLGERCHFVRWYARFCE